MDNFYKIHERDNAAVALREADGVPEGHKIALEDIGEGGKIIKYGFPVGRAKTGVKKGDHIHTHNMETCLSVRDSYEYDEEKAMAARRAYRPQAAAQEKIPAYKRHDGRIGTRNEIWIIPMVSCVNKTAEFLAARANDRFAFPSSGVDGVYAWPHPAGCSQMGDDKEAARKILAGLALHPNAAAVLILGLGCEYNTVGSFLPLLGEQPAGRIAFYEAQKSPDEMAEGMALLRRLASYAAAFRREPCDASDLIIGMKCGGSDGFSGVTANPLCGFVSDTLASVGGRAILTETPEMFGAEQLLMERAVNRPVFDKTVALINGFKDYLAANGEAISENPSPGNKSGGLSTLEDKSCGCVQKGGAAPVIDVLPYGGRVSVSGEGGVILLDAPGNDLVSATALCASGAQIILFTTGRGTPMGFPAPVIKIAANSELAARKPGWIDFDAGRLLREDADTVRAEFLRLLRQTAEGDYRTKSEVSGYREIGLWKRGVTL